MTSPLPLWREYAITAAAPHLATKINTDVAVVGAGTIGLAAAVAAARTGRSVTVIDGLELGAGSSVAAAGVFGLPPPSLDAITTGPALGADLGVVVDGAAHSLASRIAAEGWDVDLTYPGAVIWGGAGTPPAAGTLHPARLIDALATAAVEAGATLATRHPVRSLSRTTTGFQLLTSACKVVAGAVIVATSGAVGPHPMRVLRRRLASRRAAVAATGVLAPDDAAALIPPGLTTARPSRHEWSAHATRDGRVVLWHGRADRLDSLDGTTVAAATLPALRDVEFTHVWPDDTVVVADGVPRIGRVDGMWFAAGCNDPALNVSVGDHVGGLVAGGRRRSPYAEVEHRTPVSRRVRRAMPRA